MNILITGANFDNKGAQLMLESLVDSVKTRLPDARICVSPLLNNDLKIQNLGIEKLNYPLFHYGRNRIFRLALRFPWLIKLISKIKNKDVSGTINLDQIDAVFDISGFAFGDKWGLFPLQDLSFFAQQMRSKGIKFILFPQAFGSFEKPGMKDSLKQVVSSVDLLITRDKQSLLYVNEACEKHAQNVKLFADITLTFKRKIVINDNEFSLPFAAIVPNERMLDKASEGWMKNYTNTMSDIIKHTLDNSSLNVVMLIHAQGNSADAKVGTDILSKLPTEYGERVIYYVEEDPVRLKVIISKASFIVGSRFHALASALSSNVPAIGTSWLHKYEMLFDDYELREFSFTDPNEKLFVKIDELIDVDVNQKLRKNLEIINSTLQLKSEDMWKTINSILLK